MQFQTRHIIHIGRGADAHEYKTVEQRCLRAIVSLDRRENLFAYLAVLDSFTADFAMPAEKAAKHIQKLEAMGFTVAVREGWGGIFRVVADVSRAGVAPVLTRDVAPSRVPENAMPNRVTRRDIRANRKARTAYRIAKRNGVPLCR